MDSNQVVDQYGLDEKIGEGGMAEVWIATQTSMENQVDSVELWAMVP